MNRNFRPDLDEAVASAVEDMRKDRAIGKHVGDEAIATARNDAALRRAVTFLHQAANASRDAVGQWGSVDAVTARNNDEAIGHAEAALAPLAVAYVAGMKLVQSTADEMRAAHREHLDAVADREGRRRAEAAATIGMGPEAPPEGGGPATGTPGPSEGEPPPPDDPGFGPGDPPKDPEPTEDNPTGLPGRPAAGTPEPVKSPEETAPAVAEPAPGPADKQSDDVATVVNDDPPARVPDVDLAIEGRLPENPASDEANVDMKRVEDGPPDPNARDKAAYRGNKKR